MGKLNVKNGTPVGSDHLCRSCSWGQFTTGYRESEVLVFCTNTNPNFKVLFPVHACSEYHDKHQPDYEQMKKLAIDIDARRFTKKTRGFGLSEVFRPSISEVETEAEDEGEDESEAALIREAAAIYN
jgi:hypothetical protein